VALLGALRVPPPDLRERMLWLPFYHSEALRVLPSAAGGLYLLGCVLLLFKAAFQLLSLSPPAGTLARGARSRPNPLAVTGLDPGLVPAGGECYRGRLGRVQRPQVEGVLLELARQCSSGGSPMKYILSPTRLRTLILTREFGLTSEWASNTS
jgi:hypothetical protein